MTATHINPRHSRIRIARMQTLYVLALLLLTSCVGEQLLNTGNLGEIDNHLRFEASAGLTTKAANANPLASTADLQQLGHFNVSAYINRSIRFQDQLATWNGSFWELNNPIPTPQQTTTYYAYANWQNAQYNNFRTTSAGISATGLTIATDGQHDLLLAATTDSAVNHRIHLHFRHPLTTVTFRAGNIAPRKIDVLITEIAIVNVASRADLTFPDLDGNALWSNHAQPNATYVLQELAANPDDLTQAYTVPDLSATPTDYARFPRIQSAAAPLDNTLLLIPQEFDSWDPSGTVEAPDQRKTYLRLRILIKRAGLQPSDPDAHHFVYAGAADPLNNTFIPTYAYAPLASIPKKTGHWQAGKQINYILNFGDNFAPSGGGGYDKDGRPILVPIRFSLPLTAIVDDWLNAAVPLITISYPKQ